MIMSLSSVRCGSPVRLLLGFVFAASLVFAASRGISPTTPVKSAFGSGALLTGGSAVSVSRRVLAVTRPAQFTILSRTQTQHPPRTASILSKSVPGLGAATDTPPGRRPQPLPPATQRSPVLPSHAAVAADGDARPALDKDCSKPNNSSLGDRLMPSLPDLELTDLDFYRFYSPFVSREVAKKLLKEATKTESSDVILQVGPTCLPASFAMFLGDRLANTKTNPSSCETRKKLFGVDVARLYLLLCAIRSHPDGGLRGWSGSPPGTNWRRRFVPGGDPLHSGSAATFPPWLTGTWADRSCPSGSSLGADEGSDSPALARWLRTEQIEKSLARPKFLRFARRVYGGEKSGPVPSDEPVPRKVLRVLDAIEAEEGAGSGVEDHSGEEWSEFGGGGVSEALFCHLSEWLRCVLSGSSSLDSRDVDEEEGSGDELEEPQLHRLLQPCSDDSEPTFLEEFADFSPPPTAELSLLRRRCVRLDLCRFELISNFARAHERFWVECRKSSGNRYVALVSTETLCSDGDSASDSGFHLMAAVNIASVFGLETMPPVLFCQNTNGDRRILPVPRRKGRALRAGVYYFKSALFLEQLEATAWADDRVARDTGKLDVPWKCVYVSDTGKLDVKPLAVRPSG